MNDNLINYDNYIKRFDTLSLSKDERYYDALFRLGFTNLSGIQNKDLIKQAADNGHIIAKMIMKLKYNYNEIEFDSVGSQRDNTQQQDYKQSQKFIEISKEIEEKLSESHISQIKEYLYNLQKKKIKDTNDTGIVAHLVRNYNTKGKQNSELAEITHIINEQVLQETYFKIWSILNCFVEVANILKDYKDLSADEEESLQKTILEKFPKLSPDTATLIPICENFLPFSAEPNLFEMISRKVVLTLSFQENYSHESLAEIEFKVVENILNGNLKQTFNQTKAQKIDEINLATQADNIICHSVGTNKISKFRPFQDVRSEDERFTSIETEKQMNDERSSYTP